MDRASPGKREHIDRIPEQVHPDKGADDGHRNGRCNNEDTSPILEENEKNQQYQQNCFYESLSYNGDGIANVIALVVDLLKCGPLRTKFLLQAHEFFVHRINGLNNVGPHLVENTKDDTVSAVDATI